MKRRLQIYLEKTYGSAYGGQGQSPPKEPPLSPPPLLVSDGVKGKKGKTAKYKQQRLQTPPPDGGRFDLRCDADLATTREMIASSTAVYLTVFIHII